jgi:hypothetical protein
MPKVYEKINNIENKLERLEILLDDDTTIYVIQQFSKT